MSGGGVGLGSPVVAPPVGDVSRCLVGLAFPPHVTVVGQGDVGEDVAACLDGAHRGRVRRVTGARGNAEESELGVDGVELAVLAEAHPRDVVTEGLGLPAGDGRFDHGEVGLAAGRRERGSDVLDDAFGARQLENEHVLGQPALVASDRGGDAQRVALLAQQSVAAVAGSVGPDGAIFGEVGDVLRGVAGPGDVFLSLFQRGADGVDALDELPVLGVDRIEGVLARASHDEHGEHDVGRIGDLDAEHRLVRLGVAHDEGDDVHGATAHRALEQRVEGFLHLRRSDPVVERTGILLVLGADVGPALDAGDILGVGGRVVGVLGAVDTLDGAGLDELLSDLVLLCFGTIDPDDVVRGGQGGDPADEREHRLVCGRCVLQLVSDDIMVEDSHEWSPGQSRMGLLVRRLASVER